MSRSALPEFDENALPKGQLRKLNALKKSVGPEIGVEAFTKWLKSQDDGSAATVDKTAALIEERIAALVGEKKISLPRGGYCITRGRGRVIVTRAAQD